MTFENNDLLKFKCLLQEMTDHEITVIERAVNIVNAGVEGSDKHELKEAKRTLISAFGIKIPTEDIASDREINALTAEHVNLISTALAEIKMETT